MLPEAEVGTSLSVHEGYVDTSGQMLVEAGSRVKRQKRSVEEKLRIVEETLEAITYAIFRTFEEEQVWLVKLRA